MAEVREWFHGRQQHQIMGFGDTRGRVTDSIKTRSPGAIGHEPCEHVLRAFEVITGTRTAQKRRV